MTTWRILLEYDGTAFSGWQDQTNARTVSGELRRAAEDFFGVQVDLGGAGRTDAGVHALAQVAHLRVDAPAPARRDLLRALNTQLPAGIVVLDAQKAHPSFHARHDAVARRYLYRISRRKSAFEKKYVWWIKHDLDAAAMARAARLIEGRRDFRAFRAADPARPGESTLVVVSSASLVEEGHLLLFRIEASHFLWRMVRRLVGALVRLGSGELTPADWTRLLEARPSPSLDVAAWTAPASGLFLEKVVYPPAPAR